MASIAKNITKVVPRSTTSPTTIAKFVSRVQGQNAAKQVFQNSSRRQYSSESKPNLSKSSAVAGVLAFSTLFGVGSYYYGTRTRSIPEVHLTKENSSVFKATKEDYQKVYDAVAKQLWEQDDYDDGSYGPVVLRLAWHASGTYDAATGTGGSNGATMRFAPEGKHGANNGLENARKFLEPIKEQFPWVSYSDLWTLAGACAVQEMQGPTIPWRPGRQDKTADDCTPDGRLPNGAKTQNHLRAIFGRMGLNDQEIVALSGAHALGRCHKERSGFEGPWTFSPTTLTNDFFKLLVEEEWQWKKWNGNKQYEDKTTKSLMMLPSDMALVKDEEFMKHVERYAKDGAVFFSEFSDALVKLFELGVPFRKDQERMEFRILDEAETED